MKYRLTYSVALMASAWLAGTATAHAQAGPYVNFETIPSRALALSPDGSRLFVTNTPDGRLEIFDVSADGGLSPAGSVTVGLDPVAVAARNKDEVWVVNLLSDSVSVVDVTAKPARVVRTLLVGDEPRDITFAGPGGSRAFITAARRGQNHPDDVVNETQMPGLGRADVWVFDANNLGTQLGGKPLSIVTLFADKPGALTTSPDGKTVFVAIATSGNETTVINSSAVCGAAQDAPACRLGNGGTGPGGVPGPNRSQMGNVANPKTGIIVKFDRETGSWRDQAGRDWRDAVGFSLPDNDMFAIDAMANPPKETRAIQHVGTLNKSVAVDPKNGNVYVATIQAVNTNRFLSVPRLNAFPNPNPTNGVARTADPITGKTLNGHLYESRIAIVKPDGQVLSRHLNKHIDYEVVPSPSGVKERSVADPQGLVLSPDGKTLFVAALGSNQIVPFQVSELEADTFTPNAASHIDLTGNGGPTDMVMSPDGSKMFVYKRFDNAVATVDLAAKREVSVAALFSPEPNAVKDGRKFFYDARTGSSNGEANCNVCHPAADKDDLAWDLGSPFNGTSPNPNPAIIGLQQGTPFNPLKGPMTVLTLRGIKDSGPMFWRGDATNATPGDERANFQNFNPVFEALLGKDGQLPPADFAKLTDWVMTVTNFPNPHEPLNRVLNASQAAGRNIFTGGEGVTDIIFNCSSCHVLNPSMGNFGTGGSQSFEGESQLFKVTQLRTVYDKVGGFGQTKGNNGDARTLGGPRGKVGPQIRGTGTIHDGSTMAPEEFLLAGVFQLDARKLRQVVDFVYAFPTNLAPIVGQQVTLRADSGADVTARIDLFQQRAAAAFMSPAGPNLTECDLVAKGVIGGQSRGFLFQPQGGNFRDDTGQTITSAALRNLAQTPGQELTFTCMYPGGGTRFGIDRDLDGTLDGGGRAMTAR